MFKARSTTVLIALVSGLAACNDGAVAPGNQTAHQPAIVSGGGALATLTKTDTVRFSFTVNPAVSSSFFLGAGNSVRFPAGSICDPSSSYGTTEWDNSCTPATAPITVNASAWLDAAGHPRVDFANHLRFVPTSNPLNWVTLAFTDLSAAQDPSSDILYCTSAYSACVSELSGDATLVTVKNPVTGLVTRRIKHFSGYLMGSGDGCPPDNPGCTEGGAGFNRISGGLKYSATSASAKIGPEGGVLSLASAGLTVVVPRGALATTMTLSVSSRPGQLLSYEFQPHGTQFARPLVVTQDMSGTDWSSRSLSALRVVYFASESQVDDAQGVVIPTELMNVQIDEARGQASFQIHHFSGYMFASGEACMGGVQSPNCAEQESGLSANRLVPGAAASFSARLSGLKRTSSAGTHPKL
jgi:hypothetical protein